MRQLAWVLGLLALLHGGEVHAHAALVGVEPLDGAHLAEAPRHIMLHFNEPVSIIDIRLVDAAGKRHALPGAPIAQDETVHVPLPEAMADGTYLIAYRITSSDSHPVGGTVMFTLGVAAADVGALRARLEAQGDGWLWPSRVLRVGFLVFAALVAGGVMFAIIVAPLVASTRRLLGWLAIAGIAITIAHFAVGTAMMLGGPPEALLSPATWLDGLATPMGHSLALATLGFVLLAVGLARPARRRESVPATAGAAIVALSLVLAGHSAGDGSLLVQAAALVHGACALFWIGALIPLLAALRGDGAATIVERFSGRAIVAVGLLCVAGIALSAAHLETAEALVTTTYGRLLLLKLAFVLALLALAAWNKLRLTRRWRLGDARGAGTLARSIRVEIALAAVILALAGGLGMTPLPAGARVESHADHVHAVAARIERRVLSGQGVVASLELSPARAGDNRLQLWLMSAAGQPLEPREVTVELLHPALENASIRRRLRANDKGEYVLEGPEFALAGAWQVRLEVLITDFSMAMLETEIPVR